MHGALLGYIQTTDGHNTVYSVRQYSRLTIIQPSLKYLKPPIVIE